MWFLDSCPEPHCNPNSLASPYYTSKHPNEIVGSRFNFLLHPQLLHSGPLISSTVPSFFPPPPPPPLGPPPPSPPPPPPDLGAGFTPAAARLLFLTLKDDRSAAAWASSYAPQLISRRIQFPLAYIYPTYRKQGSHIEAEESICAIGIATKSS